MPPKRRASILKVRQSDVQEFREEIEEEITDKFDRNRRVSFSRERFVQHYDKVDQQMLHSPQKELISEISGSTEGSKMSISNFTTPNRDIPTPLGNTTYELFGANFGTLNAAPVNTQLGDSTRMDISNTTYRRSINQFESTAILFRNDVPTDQSLDQPHLLQNFLDGQPIMVDQEKTVNLFLSTPSTNTSRLNFDGFSNKMAENLDRTARMICDMDMDISSMNQNTSVNNDPYQPGTFQGDDTIALFDLNRPKGQENFRIPEVNASTMDMSTTLEMIIKEKLSVTLSSTEVNECDGTMQIFSKEALDNMTPKIVPQKQSHTILDDEHQTMHNTPEPINEDIHLHEAELMSFRQEDSGKTVKTPSDVDKSISLNFGEIATNTSDRAIPLKEDYKKSPVQQFEENTNTSGMDTSATIEMEKERFSTSQATPKVDERNESRETFLKESRHNTTPKAVPYKKSRREYDEAEIEKKHPDDDELKISNEEKHSAEPLNRDAEKVFELGVDVSSVHVSEIATLARPELSHGDSMVLKSSAIFETHCQIKEKCHPFEEKPNISRVINSSVVRPREESRNISRMDVSAVIEKAKEKLSVTQLTYEVSECDGTIQTFMTEPLDNTTPEVVSNKKSQKDCEDEQLEKQKAYEAEQLNLHEEVKLMVENARAGFEFDRRIKTLIKETVGRKQECMERLARYRTATSLGQSQAGSICF